MYMYVHIEISLHAYVYTHIYVYIDTHTYVFIHIFMHVHDTNRFVSFIISYCEIFLFASNIVCSAFHNCSFNNSIVLIDLSRIVSFSTNVVMYIDSTTDFCVFMNIHQIYLYIYIHKNLFLYIYIHTYIYTYIYIYIYVFTYMYIHKYICSYI
jgi:hypothetical protein